jgi:AcrR family transcriptional regulator
VIFLIWEDRSLRKPPRRTRERIIELALKLYNEFGEPNVTTTVIADEMNISPGNLYYHFRNKDEITDSVFEGFEKEMDTLLDLPKDRQLNIEDAWFFLHLLFETIWRYRCFYRDLNDLLSRNRKLELQFQRILDRKSKAALRLCTDLVSSGTMTASARELEALSTNMVLTSTYWLSFEYVRHARQFNDPAAQSRSIARGAYQVLTLIAPYLSGQARELFEHLAQSYLEKMKDNQHG